MIVGIIALGCASADALDETKARRRTSIGARKLVASKGNGSVTNSLSRAALVGSFAGNLGWVIYTPTVHLIVFALLG